ncbi:MAG: hypothetical protein PVG03_03560 [Desulfarculaceae bacterium]|jgi:uncharacterized protein with PQ loop repeat
MAKRIIWAVVAVFLAWAILDFLIHGVLLRSAYEATASMWRPMNEMNLPLMYFVTLIFSLCFVLIYGLLIGQKSVTSGIKFGALFGLAVGVSAGFGSYVFMPIPLSLAWSWLFGTWAQGVVAGVIVGVIVKS